MSVQNLIFRLRIVHYGKRITFAFIMLVCADGCLSRIDIPIDRAEPQLVIFGQISSIAENSIIQIGTTAQTDRLPIPVVDALVAVYDESDHFFDFSPIPEQPGTYIGIGAEGLTGKHYYVEVILPSGRTYRSKPELLPEKVGNCTTYYEFADENYTDGDGTVTLRHFLKIYADANLPASADPLYLRWHVQEDYLFSPTDFPDVFGTIPPPCYISQNAEPQRIVLHNGAEVQTAVLPNLLLASRLIDPSFHERHYFTTYQTSLTREAFDFWNQVRLTASQVGSIFDTPPAKIRGNLYNINDSDEMVHGYFQAVNQSYDRFFTLPSDLPFTLQRYCLYAPERAENDYPSECMDCLRAPNSSYRRPSWF
jgi:hypothetical protein